MATNLYEFYKSKNQALPSISERQKIAQQAGIQGYSGTAAQNTQLLSFLQGGAQNPAISNLPNVNAGLLGTPSNINIPQQQQLSSPDTMIAGLLAGYQPIDVTKGNAYSQATQQLQQQAGGITAAQRRILELSGQMEGKAAREGELQQQFGLTEKQLAEDTAARKISDTQKAYLAESIAVGGRPIGLERQGGKLDQLRRREAIDLIGQSIVLDAARGDVQSAQRSIDNALKLEFEPIQARIETTKQFLEFNMDNFNRAEKQQAQALNVKLDREKQAMENAREARRINASMAMELLKSGNLNSSTFSDILSGKSNIADALKNTNINAANLGTDPLTSLETVIKNSGAKADDKLKLTGSVVAVAQKFAGNNPGGKIPGLAPVTTKINLFLGPKGQSNRTYLDTLKGTVESWMTGAAVSKDQEKRIRDNMIPNVTDTDKQVRNKVNALTNYMLDFASGNLATQGINYRPQTIDLFTMQTDPLGLGIDFNETNSTNSDPLGLMVTGF